MKKKLFLLGGLIASTTPFLALAQLQDSCYTQFSGAGKGSSISLLLCRFGLYVNYIIPILITLGIAYFIWGLISYAIAKDEEAKTKGRGAMIWGLIAILVMVSIWGLIAVLQNTFGIGTNDTNNANIAIPCISTAGNYCPCANDPEGLACCGVTYSSTGVPSAPTKCCDTMNAIGAPSATKPSGC